MSCPWQHSCGHSTKITNSPESAGLPAGEAGAPRSLHEADSIEGGRRLRQIGEAIDFQARDGDVIRADRSPISEVGRAFENRGTIPIAAQNQTDSSLAHFAVRVRHDMDADWLWRMLTAIGKNGVMHDIAPFITRDEALAQEIP